MIPRPQNLPSFLEDLIAYQAYETLISLPIYMKTALLFLQPEIKSARGPCDKLRINRK